MANAWGTSWGASWGNSWGTAGVLAKHASDSAAVRLTEAKAIAATVAGADTLAPKVTEALQGIVLGNRADSILPRVDEALPLIVVPRTVADDLTLTPDDELKLFAPNVTGRVIFVQEPPRLILVGR